MSFALGADAKLYRNTGTYGTPTWNEVTNCKDLSLPLTKAEADATTRGNGGWEATVQTLKKAAVSFSMVWDPSDADLTAIRDAYLNNTAVEFLVLDGPQATPGSQGLRATCQVSKFDKKEPVAGLQDVEVEIKPTYSANAPSWYTAS